MPLQAVYPVAEGLTTGVLTTVNNVGCLSFLLVQNIPNIGTLWMNYAVTGACLLSLLVITPLSERQKRLAFDLADGEGSVP